MERICCLRLLLAHYLPGVYERVVRFLRGRRAVASMLVCLFVALVIILPIIGIGSIVGHEISGVTERIRSDDSRERHTIEKIVATTVALPITKSIVAKVETGKIDKSITSAITAVSKKIGPLLSKTYKGIIGGMIWTFVLFFSLFYFFIDGKKFVKKIMYLSPLKDRHEEMLIDRFVSMTRATLKSTFVIGGIQSAIGGIAFLIAGVSSPMIWTVLMLFLAIIPALGAGLIIFPAGVIMLLLGYTWQGIFLLIVGAFVTSIDNFLRPKLVGSDTKMHSILVFFATIGGMSVFGLIGFIVGPIIMALAIALWDIYAVEFHAQLKKFNR